MRNTEKIRARPAAGCQHAPADVIPVLMEVVRSQPGVLGDPPPDVLCVGFGDSSIDYVILGWTGGYLDAIRIKSQLALRVYAALRREGIEIPFPQQDIHIVSVSEEAAKRLGDYPKVPSTYELGYKVSTSTTRGYWVLKGTPRHHIEILSKALVKAMKHKTFAGYLATAGLTVEDSVAGYEVWDKHIKAEYKTAVAALGALGLLKKKK